MRLIVDYDGELHYQQIGARAPQGPSFPNDNTPPQSSNDNSKAVRTIIEYFFLIMALLVASVLVFRRIFYRRKIYQTNRFARNRWSPHSPPLTPGPPRVNPQGYPLLDSYFIAVPLPAASHTRQIRSQDVDIEGRRFTSAGAEVDHDGALRDKDFLPKYETLGAPPKYAESELQHVVARGSEGNRNGNGTPSTEVPSSLPPPLPARSMQNGRILSVPPETSSPDQIISNPGTLSSTRP